MAEFKTYRKLINRVIVAKASRTNIRQGTSTNTPVLATIDRGKVMGTSTGRYTALDDGNWYEFILVLPAGGGKGFARGDVIKILTESESKSLQQKGKDLVNKLINSDVEIFHVLARCGAILNNFIDKGINVSKYQKAHQGLYRRLSRRQEKIKASRLVSYNTGFKRGFKKTIQALKTYISVTYGINIGAVPVAAVVISAAIGAGLAVTAYFVFKADYSESKADLNISNDLERALKSLDPETAGKVIEDLEGQVDTAYTRGKTEGKFTGAFGTLKTLLIFLAGFFVVDLFVGLQSKKRKNG